jgi:cation:H+ antiporter
MITEIITNPLILNLFIVIASLVLMAKASDLAVYGVSRYARKLGLSDYIVGILIVAIAASMPELVASITGATLGNDGIVLGTLFGSNLAGLALVLGITTIFGKKVSTKSKVLRGTNLFMWGLIMLPILLLFDGKLSRIDGIFLVLAFIFYVVYIWRKEGSLGKVKKDVKFETILKDGFIFAGSLIVILLSARYLVFSSIMIANSLGISSFLIALSVIAIGATMPDIMVAIKSVKQKHEGVGYGNVVGSMVVKALLFLGVIAIINPIEYSVLALGNLIFFRTAMVTLVLFWATKGMIKRKQGLVLLLMYAIFMIIEVMLSNLIVL